MPDPTYPAPRLGWPDWPGTQGPAPAPLGAGIAAQILGQAGLPGPVSPAARQQYDVLNPLPEMMRQARLEQDAAGARIGLEGDAQPAYMKGRRQLESLLEGLRPDIAAQIMQQYDLAATFSDKSPESIAALPASLQGAILGGYQQSQLLDQIDADEQSSIADLMAAWEASSGMIDRQVAGQQAQMMAAQQMIGPLMQRYTADVGQNAQMSGDLMRGYQQYLPPEAAALVGALADQQQGQAGRMATAYQASAQAIPAINSLAAARQYQDSLQQQQMDMMAQLTQLRESARQRRSEAMTPVAPVSNDFAAQLAAIGG